MNILYIIGNGLDIAYHLKTSYQDFFKYYLGQLTFDKEILAMKNDIDNHRYETWADLEMGMGEYSSHCASKEVFLKCLYDIKSNLREYLQKESEKIKLYKLNSFSNFLDPSSFLDPESKLKYDGLSSLMSQDLSISVMTFNYTSTLEWLFDYGGRAKQFPYNSAVLETIQHVHGTLANMMVMGVNDSSQIANTKISSDIDIVEDFVKPEYNDACMNNKNNICESLINKADVIVLYGTSIGLSDAKWWRFIGQRLNNEKYPLLVYLPYDKKKDLAAEPNRLRRWVGQSVKEIKEKFDIQLDDKILASRMCVAFNKQILDVVKNTK